MSYQVKPKRWTYSNELKTIAATDGLIIECEAVHPPSAAGRTVYVHILAEDVADVIKDLRSTAIAQRRKTMG